MESSAIESQRQSSSAKHVLGAKQLPKPSRVIEVQNLFPRASEGHLHDALSRFGHIAYIKCLGSMEQKALVEFEELQAAKKCMEFVNGGSVNVAGYPANFCYYKSQHIERSKLESPVRNRILLITVHNAKYPIDVDLIRQICATYGKVKNAALVEGALVQALVEFANVEMAVETKRSLNGKDIFAGCCTIKIEFANVNGVTLPKRKQIEKSPYANKEDALKNPIQNQYQYGINGIATGHEFDYQVENIRMDNQFQEMANRNSFVDHYSNFVDYAALDVGFNKLLPFVHENAAPAQNAFILNDIIDLRIPNVCANFASSSVSAVLVINGVDQLNFNCEKIFNLLCCFGDCLKVNFLQNKRFTCVVEMRCREHVTNAIKYLDGCTVFGAVLNLTASSEKSMKPVVAPLPLLDETPSFVDYSSSRNHRFSTPVTAVRNRLHVPSKTLYWFNVPPGFTVEKLNTIFDEKASVSADSVQIFHTVSDRSSQGVAEFSSVEDAFEVLVLANHTPIAFGAGKPYIMKLAFSGTTSNKDSVEIKHE